MAGNEGRAIEFADPALARMQGFTSVPNVILRSGLPATAKLILSVLISYAWQESSCFPSQERICADLGIGKRGLRSGMSALTGCGVLRQVRRGLGKTNRYEIDLSPKVLSRVAEFAPAEPPEIDEKGTSGVTEKALLDGAQTHLLDGAQAHYPSSTNTHLTNTHSLSGGAVAPPDEKGTRGSAPSTAPTPEAKPDPPNPKPKPKRDDTWLTPYIVAWREVMDAEPVAGKLARYLRPLDERHGREKAERHLRNWLRAHQGAGARYLDLAKFAETFGQWSGAEVATGGGGNLHAGEKTAAASRRMLERAAVRQAEREAREAAEREVG